jgi:hypothetical protein
MGTLLHLCLASSQIQGCFFLVERLSENTAHTQKPGYLYLCAGELNSPMAGYLVRYPFET